MFYWPAPVYAQVYMRPSYAEFLRPFGDRACLAEGRKILGFLGFVSHLLRVIRPMSVFGRVVAIVVNSIQCMVCRRSISDIGEEVFKGLPAFADFDASAAIAVKTRSIRVTTAPDHVDPHMIERMLIGAPRDSGCSDPGAAARYCEPVTKVCAADKAFCSASATTFPARCPGSIADGREDGPFTENLVREVNSNGHGSLSERLSDLAAARVWEHGLPLSP